MRTAIETKRLRLIPLFGEELDWWANDLPRLERALNCSYQGEPVEGFFREIIRGQQKMVETDPQNVLWHSFWLMVRKADQIVVGTVDFKNVPNEAGEVEIGYGLATKFQHQGYMTEAVQAMCGWALAQPGVKYILAETERDNAASQNVLQRCGFGEDHSEETIWWKRSFCCKS